MKKEIKQQALFSEEEVPVVKPKEPEPIPERREDYWIDELVGAICDPIIVWPGGGWENDIPEWLFTQIKLERLVMNMRAAHGEKMTATDAEALAYMFPLTLERPIDHRWTRIYQYLGTKVCKAYSKVEVPEDIRVEKLDDYDMRQLNDLKDFIYKKRVERRKEKARERRREEKEKIEVERVNEQPPLL
jgi:hypothetical protein